ncbi:hypothetical protein QTP70_002660, partial [Hemibagrus guttatus]
MAVVVNPGLDRSAKLARTGSTLMAIMWYKEEDDFYLRRDREKVNRHVKIELPPPFSGDEKQSFLCWTRQFEVAVRAITEGDDAASVNYELVRILPTRLAGAAFLLWDSLPATVQGDYNTVKERLKEAFGQRQFMDRFRASLSGPPLCPARNVAFKIYTDPSKLAVGAVLAQDRDGLEHVVAYASWALNSSQKRWSTFDHHRPLLAIRCLSIDDDPTGRRGRWILELDPLNWVIVHKDGKQHKNADALSRRPDTPSPSEAEASVGEVLEVNVSAQTVARCLFEDYVLIHGVPETLHSDQGRQFEVEVVQNLCHLLNIKKTRTTSYHPKSDGAMVWLHNPVESRMKLAPHWKGPYRIAQVMDSCGEQGLTYRIENPFDS